jgi:hypothetical protein
MRWRRVAPDGKRKRGRGKEGGRDREGMERGRGMDGEGGGRDREGSRVRGRYARWRCGIIYV